MNNRTKFILIVITGIIGAGLISSIFFNTLPKLNDLIRATLVRLSATVPAHCSVTSLDGEEIIEGELSSTTNAVPIFTGFANINQGNLTFEIDDGLVTGVAEADSQGYWSWGSSRALSPEVHSLYITAQHPNNDSIRATCTLTFRVIPSGGFVFQPIIPLPAEKIIEEVSEEEIVPEEEIPEKVLEIIFEKVQTKIVEIAKKIANLRIQITQLFRKVISKKPPEEIIPSEEIIPPEEAKSIKKEVRAITVEEEPISFWQRIKQGIVNFWKTIVNFWKKLLPKIWPF